MSEQKTPNPATGYSVETTMETKKFVAYLRISKQKAGTQGLSEEGQSRAVEAFVKSRAGHIVATFQEIESGKNDRRPELLKAMSLAKSIGATLVIAKLDRLSRNASFTMALKESGVDFIAADMPEANTFMIGIMALVAQQERDFISSRTKAALQSKRERGWVPRKPVGFTRETALKGAMAVKEAAREKQSNKMAHAFATNLRKQGMTLEQIAARLNEGGFPTSKGCGWHKTSVKRVLEMMA